MTESIYTPPDLPKSLDDREYGKFELDDDGKVRVRTVTTGSLTGEIRPSGLNNLGRVTEVVLNDTTWTALPAAALTDRNAIGVQNLSGKEIKVNFSDLVSGYVGMVIADGSERTYDITDSIVLYGKVSTGLGNAVVNVEEIS